MKVTRDIYDFVVVDAGSRIDLMDSTLFDESATIFLITQVGISEMRTANRMIGKYFARRGENLQIVSIATKPATRSLTKRRSPKP